MRECGLYTRLKKELVQCQACSHFCKIAPGKVGICGVRQNLNGKLYLLVFGKAVAVNVDPIEKKPLFHFLPGSSAFSFGTLGCNFRCANCQNYDIAQMFEEKGKTASYREINWGKNLAPAEIVDLALANNCQSIAYTYNEPTVFVEYGLATMKLARKKGLKNVWVSNGFMSGKTLDLIIPYLDAINVDIKSFREDFYQSNCGAKLKPALANCIRLVKEKIWLEVTTLMIPTLSDDLRMIKNIADFIKQELGSFVPWHISAFSGEISWKLKHLPETPIETIEKAYQIGKKVGLKYVYAGNVWHGSMENTFCPNCHETVVERKGYLITREDRQGKCPQCGLKIEGEF